MTKRSLPVSMCALAATLVAAASVSAQERCASVVRTPEMNPVRMWSPPLGRALTLHAPAISLREALERIARAARVRISYSAELLPLGRQACLSFDSVSTGSALTSLLDGTSVEPVAAGGDHIVLAPVRTRPATTAQSTQFDSVYSLKPVIAIANAVALAHATSPVDIEVIDGRALAEQGVSSLGGALNGSVPGLWLWNTSASSLLAQYGSLRGASSFGLSSPKVYIDGIAVANPLLVTRISPDAVERVEVIRGPQATALYGADALSGVTNIITRRSDGSAGTPRVRMSTNFGVSASDYSASSPLAQDHSIGIQAGSSRRSAALNLQLGSTGAFVPGAFGQHASVDASGQLVSERTLLTGTLRYFAERTGTPSSPLLTDYSLDPASRIPSSLNDPLGMQQYTAGLNLSYHHNERWQHSFVFGVDGYLIDGTTAGARQFLPSPADSALRAAGAGGSRVTMRFGSIAQLFGGEQARASVALSAEHSILRQVGDVSVFRMNSQWSSSNRQNDTRMAWRFSSVEPTELKTTQQQVVGSSTAGLSAQLNTTLLDRLYLTGGLRAERLGVNAARDRTALLPTLGASMTAGDDLLGLKLRAAYGRGIRWPQLPVGTATNSGLAAEYAALEPEQQAGVEAGFDLNVGRALTLQVTRFDQTASGLVQRVAVAPSAVGYNGVAYQLQNVGVITNRGWELQTSVQRGRLGLAGTMSVVDSRVQQLAEHYTGDLQPGDRMLAVPAHTFGISATWNGTGWSSALSLTRATDWINYDQLALARYHALATSQPTTTSTFVSRNLREFWKSYSGITHLRAAFSRELGYGFTLLLSGDNLLNRQIGEPDNITIMPGRTLSLGIRTSF